MKYKYNVSYIKDGEIIPLKYKNKKMFDSDLRTIDRSTLILSSEGEVLYYLKGMKLIPEDVDKLYISRTEIINGEEVENIIYDGDILLFEEDKNKFNTEYIQKTLSFFKSRINISTLAKLFELYYKKYNLPKYKLEQKKYIHFANMLNRVKKILLLIDKRLNNIFEVDPEVEKKLDKAIEEFYNKEFLNITKNGTTLKYGNVRDFIIKVKYAYGEYDVDRKHTYLDNNKKPEVETQEEFLTEEDFVRSTNEILKTYNNDFVPYQDGNDYITPLTKEELSNIDDMGTSLNLKRNN